MIGDGADERVEQQREQDEGREHEQLLLDVGMLPHGRVVEHSLADLWKLETNRDRYSGDFNSSGLGYLYDSQPVF